jgi:ketosteroid isomerase-like protein
MVSILKPPRWGAHLLALAATIAFTAGPVRAQSASDASDARQAIWAQEQLIYKARAKGSLDYYLASTAEGYLAWPPNHTAPIGTAGLRKDAAAMKSRPQEQSELELVDFTLNGSTAIIYYVNSVTLTGASSSTIKRYDNIHVWVREAGVWRLMGGMSRMQPQGQ